MHESDGLNHQPGLTQYGVVNLAAILGEWLQRIFSCWHRQMSWPFTTDGETYRVCLHCGARRRFVPESWRTVGHFYRGAADQARPPRSYRLRLWQRRPGAQSEPAAYSAQTLTPS